MAKTHVCFDIGSEYLKMVEVSAEAGGVQLKNFAVAPLEQKPEMTNEDRNSSMAQAVRGMLAEKRIRTKTISISISGQSVFTRFVQLPPVDETKIAQIIKFEAQQQVPFPIDEVEWDYHVIGSGKTEEINVVLVAIKKEIVMGMVKALKKAGYEVDTISAAPLSIYNTIAFNEDLYSGATAVIDLGAKTTTLIVCDGEGMWSRNIPIGGENITQAISKDMDVDAAAAEALKKGSYVEYEGGGAPSGISEQGRQAAKTIAGVCGRLISEVRRSIGFYRTQSKGANIQRVLLSGGGIMLPLFREFMESTLKVPVERIFPIKKMSVATTLDRNTLNTDMHLLCDAIGLGIRMVGKSRISVNLLPKIIAYQKELSRKKVFIAGAAICLIATILSFAMKAKKERDVAYVPKIAEFNAEIGRLSPFKNDITRLKSELGKLDSRIRIINKLQNARLYWVDFIDTLKKKKPRNAWFTEIKVGGIERSKISSSYGGMGGTGYGGFNPYGTGGYGGLSPYGSMPGPGSMGSSGGGMTNPYSKETSVEGEKGYIELTGYLRVRKMTGRTQDLAPQVEELRLTLESRKQKEELNLDWTNFNSNPMPKKPGQSTLLNVIFGQLLERKKILEGQVKAYSQGVVIPTDFLTEKALDGFFEEAAKTAAANPSLAKDYQELKDYYDKFEVMLATFNITAKSDFFGTIEPIRYEQLEYLVDVAKFVFKARLNRAIEF